MAEPSWIDDFDPEEIEVQAMDGFHLGGSRFSASFELSDPDAEFGRSYLLEIDLGKVIRYGVRLQIEDSIRSHVSFAWDHHVALELGGIIHDLLPGGGAAQTVLPEGALHKLWAQSPDRLFAIGNLGVSYLREGGVWVQLETFEAAVLKDVGGRAAGPVYLVGNRGVVTELDGRRWRPVDLPTAEHFNAVSVGPEGEVYLGGAAGAAYELRAGELIGLQGEATDYQDICAFRGKRYWTDTEYGLSVQEGQRITPLLPIGEGFSMHASADCLVVASWHEFFVFDGTDWTGFELGWNGDIYLSRVDMADYTR